MFGFKKKLQASTPEGYKTSTDVLSISRRKPVSINSYTDKKSQSDALRKKYHNEDEKGNDLAKVIVNSLVSWISGNGISVSTEDEKYNERIQDFLNYNKLNSSKFIRIVREIVFDAEVLLMLTKEKHPIYLDSFIKVRYMSREKYQYELVFSPDDPDRVIEVKYKDANKEEQVLTEGNFVYMSFGETPILGNILSNLDKLDDLISHLSFNNKLFGTPTPAGKTANMDDAVSMVENLKSKDSVDSDSIKWEPGDMLIGPMDFYFVEPNGQAAAGIEKEFNLRIQVASGGSGMPVHLMGFVSLFGTKAGADSLLEQINTATNEYRTLCCELMEELVIRQSILMGDSIQTVKKAKLNVTLPLNTIIQLMMLSQYYLPLYKEGIIDRDTMIDLVPGVDSEIIKERLDSAEAKKMETALNDFKMMQQTQGDNPQVQSNNTNSDQTKEKVTNV